MAPPPRPEPADQPLARPLRRRGGRPRLLDLLAEEGLSSPWFVPGHAVDSFPDPCERVVAEGHEVAHHGWSHTRPGEHDSREAELADVERGVGSIESLTGDTPEGYRSPS